MKAVVMAGGEGSRLRPLTQSRPKPLAPVANKPVMEHIVDLLKRHGVAEIVATVHYLADEVEAYFGDGSDFGVTMSYVVEDTPLGTAGAVKMAEDRLDDTFIVMSGDALTDIDLGAFVARHRAAGGVATLAVKQVSDTREYGVVLHDSEGRITGFQEKPEPEEALSNLGNCGIYIFEPEIFDYFPERPFADWAQDVFPTLLANDVPFHIHEIRDYWNDVGSLAELRQGTFDALRGELRLEVDGKEARPGVILAGEQALPDDLAIDGQAWIGHDVQIGSGVRLMGPLVLGDGARVGDGAQLRESIVFPGTAVAPGGIMIGAIAGHSGILESLRPRQIGS